MYESPSLHRRRSDLGHEDGPFGLVRRDSGGSLGGTSPDSQQSWGEAMGPQPKNAFTIRVLGGFLVHQGSQILYLRPSTRRLVALLAVEDLVSRGDIAARLYDSVPMAKAVGNLRTALWRLHADAPGIVQSHGDTLGLADSVTTVDVHDARAWFQWSAHAGAEVKDPPARADQELLPGWGDQWLIEHRERLRLQQVQAWEQQALRLLLMGRLAEACECAQVAISLDPLRETATRLFIDAALRQGNAVEALVRYRSFEERLRREGCGRPGPAIAALVARILPPQRQSAPGPGPAAPGGGGPVTSRLAHHLQD